MASGLVPVAARKGGAIGIIEDGKSGLLTKPLDAEDMAQKIEWLINNPEIMKDFSKNATNRAKDFEWEKILNRLFTRYDEIIKEFRLKKGKRAA
jgi:glycosyltransferase involved in cell wall biosynthesis